MARHTNRDAFRQKPLRSEGTRTLADRTTESGELKPIAYSPLKPSFFPGNPDRGRRRKGRRNRNKT